jgi:hypothetical protein
MQRRPEIWGADAAEFSPDRWLRADAGKMLREVGWGNMPFSGGPRICPGRKYCEVDFPFLSWRVLRLGWLSDELAMLWRYSALPWEREVMGDGSSGVRRSRR